PAIRAVFNVVLLISCSKRESSVSVSCCDWAVHSRKERSERTRSASCSALRPSPARRIARSPSRANQPPFSLSGMRAFLLLLSLALCALACVAAKPVIGQSSGRRRAQRAGCSTQAQQQERGKRGVSCVRSCCSQCEFPE